MEGGETKLEHEVVVILNHVSDGDPDSSQGVLNDILTQLAGVGDGDRVGIDHSETFRID